MARMVRQSLVKFDAPLCETIVDTPKPQGREVLVRIERCGLCHSDLHIQDGYADLGGGKKLDTTRGMTLPFTLGHENAGWVHALGEGVTGLSVGEPVAVYGPWGCGTCERCRLGIETYCENPAGAPAPAGGGGLGIDGGMADYLLVPAARHVVPLPEGLDPVRAAPLTDAGLTPYHAIRRSWPKLTPGSSAVAK